MLNFNFFLGSISGTFRNFSTEFFSMYRGILELKTILAFYAKIALSQKNVWRLDCTIFKTKNYFCRSSFGNKQIKKNY